jgi:hypothetical protein
MENKNLPAFPTLEKGGDGQLELSSEGLTKREYIATMAMQAITASYAGLTADPKIEAVVKKSIDMADELLKQLQS